MIDADKIVETLCKCGYEAYIVGGAVRDMFLSKDPNDEDIVTNASPEEIGLIFKNEKVDMVGANFLVTMVNGIDVSTYRKDMNTKPGRENCEVTQCKTLQEDLHKRDFTINAIATCPYTGEIIDPFDGREDLKNKIIKFVGDPGQRIKEDYLRMLRAARFCCLIQGTIDKRTMDALKGHSFLVNHIAKERIRSEFLKVMEYEKPSIFFDVLHEAGILAQLIPELDYMYGHTGGKYHEETLDVHFKITGDSISSKDKLLRLTGYLHDIGKPAAYIMHDGENFVDHEKFGADLVRYYLRKYKFSTEEVTRVTNLVKYHMRSFSQTITKKAIRRMLRKFTEHNVNWKDWFKLKVADNIANIGKPNYTKKEIKAFSLKVKEAMNYEDKCFKITDLNINGNQVMEITGLSPGKEIGEILSHLFDIVIDTPQMNNYETLSNVVTGIYKRKKEEMSNESGI